MILTRQMFREEWAPSRSNTSITKLASLLIAPRLETVHAMQTGTVRIFNFDSRQNPTESYVVSLFAAVQSVCFSYHYLTPHSSPLVRLLLLLPFFFLFVLFWTGPALILGRLFRWGGLRDRRRYQQLQSGWSHLMLLGMSLYLWRQGGLLQGISTVWLALLTLNALASIVVRLAPEWLARKDSEIRNGA